MSTPAILLWDQAYNRNGDSTIPRAVVNVIRTYMDNDSLAGWVKRSTLMADTGLSERQVDRQIAANIKARWLEITSPGHSGGKSNDYRLTYPKADTSVMEMQTDMSALTDLSTKGRQICLPNTDIYVSPTTPSTSPKRSTSPVRDTDINVCLPPDPFARSGDGEKYYSDPWGSVGVDHLPRDATSELNTDIYVCLSSDTDVSLPKADTDDPLGLIAEFKLSNRYLEPRHSVVLWPSDKPLPDDYYPQDPFRSSTYIDDKTGVALTG